MDIPNPQPSPQPNNQSSTTKNIKNLSIKEFFTNRLMRARSFENDETPNWFDEFKARMSKKSQSKAGAPFTCITTAEDFYDQSSDSGELFRSSPKPPKQRSGKLSNISPQVKDDCDFKWIELSEISPSETSKITQNTSKSSSKPVGLRSRKQPRFSSINNPDFDTASISTQFNRRDMRYRSDLSKSRWTRIYYFISRIFSRIVLFLIPFNHDMVWKILTFMSSALALIVLGFIGRPNSDISVFSFVGGFIIGLLIAICCIVILIISLIVQISPNSEAGDLKLGEKESMETLVIRRSPDNLSNINITDDRYSDSLEQISDEYSSIAVLDSSEIINGLNTENVLDDHDYKGWMIEFIGDYELRNKSDIKLKPMFVKIETRILSICKPKNSHEAESQSPIFVHQRVFDLNTVKKFSAQLLLPNYVRNRQKWVWSKKYPIRLSFQVDCDEQTNKGTTGPANSKSINLTLFAKSCREKEEWFRRFKYILDDFKLARGKKSSIQSDISVAHEAIEFDRLLNLSPKLHPSSMTNNYVQTSRSSHILSGSKVALDDSGTVLKTNTTFKRTKSCENLSADQIADDEISNLNRSDDETLQFTVGAQDDSTLTKETSEMFSQALNYSNFIESRSSISYKEYIENVITSGQEATSTSDWFNALTGRIFFDVFSQTFWNLWFKRKIQRKLHRIRLPYFMETLTLTNIDLGTNAPQFLNVVSHSFDSFGLSIDLEMAYSGGLTMTFETKLNLLKIKSDNSSANQSGTSNYSSSTTTNASVAAVTTATATNVGASGNNNQSSSSTSQSIDIDCKDSSSVSNSSMDYNHGDHKTKSTNHNSPTSTKTSGESSESDESESDTSSDSSLNEDADEISDWEDYGAEKTRQSIVRFVDKIASSRYFQHATENRYIKKKLQDISNCPLILVVQIQSLNGVLTLNVPPPQTDRIWYGFKPNPELTLKALPKMGDREVNLVHVTDWIERKLAEEFRKILVIPNMEDIVLPVLKSDHLSYVTPTK